MVSKFFSDSRPIEMPVALQINPNLFGLTLTSFVEIHFTAVLQHFFYRCVDFDSALCLPFPLRLILLCIC